MPGAKAGTAQLQKMCTSAAVHTLYMVIKFCSALLEQPHSSLQLHMPPTALSEVKEDDVVCNDQRLALLLFILCLLTILSYTAKIP